MGEVQLSEDLKGKYRIVNTHMPLLHHPKLGWLDFRTMTVEQAESLIAAGTMYLEKIKTKSKKPSQS